MSARDERPDTTQDVCLLCNGAGITTGPLTPPDGKWVICVQDHSHYDVSVKASKLVASGYDVVSSTQTQYGMTITLQWRWR